MIPSIEAIVEDLAAGKITKAQAISWLHMHAEGTANDLRDMFAGQALVWCLSEFGGNSDDQQQFEAAAYQIADRMLAERAKAGQ